VDAVHASYYAVLHVWIGLFGTSEIAVRSLSTVCFSLAAAGFFLFAQRERGIFVAVMASVVFVALPRVAWYAGEARGYALSLAAATWSCVALQAGLRRSEKGQNANASVQWILYGVLLAATVAFGMFSCLVWVAHIVYIAQWARRHNKVPRGLAAAGCGAVLIAGLIFLTAFRQRSQLDWIHLSAFRVLGGVVIGQLFLGTQHGISPVVYACASLSALIFAGLVIVAVVRARQGFQDLAWAALAGFAIPTVLLAGLTLAGVQVYQERYLLTSAPWRCLLAALGLAQIARRQQILALVAVVALVASCVPAQIAQRGTDVKAGEDYRALAQLAVGSQQVVYVEDDARGIGIAYPAALAGAVDSLQAESPQASGTLWGINRPAVEWTPEGRVTVYWRTTDPAGLNTPIAVVLENSNCRMTGDRQVGERFSGEVYDC
jgi:mannosyltransferase